MTEYKYIGRSSTGQKVTGSIKARDKPSAIEALLMGGTVPERVKKVGIQGTTKSWFEFESGGLTSREVGLFSEDLARLLISGFSLHPALKMVAASTESKRIRLLAKNSADHLGHGGQLSTILENQPDVHAKALAGIVKAGETSGDLDTLLVHAGETFGKSAAFREKLSSALIYPAILLFMISLTMVVFFTFVIPRLSPLFEDVGERLPFVTKVLLSTGVWMEFWFPWILALGLAGFIAVKLLPNFRKKTTLWRHKRIASLSFGISPLVSYATYSRIIGLLILSGIPLPIANDVASKSVRNMFLSGSLQETTKPLREGIALSALLLQCPKVPDVLTRMCALGENSGMLGQALMDVSGILERKAEMRTDRVLTLLTPAVTIILGLIVAFVVAALFLGIASLTEIDI